MLRIATVVDVTPTSKGPGGSATPIDIVVLAYDGRRYTWEAEPGRFEIGQQVPVEPPRSLGANITLAAAG